MTSSDTSIVNVSLERYFLNPEDTTSKKMERIKITGVTEGTADVYIYKRGDHTATVHMTITPAIPPFHVSDHSVTIDQGESVRIPITSGGGNYTEDQDYDKTIVYADADTNADNLTGKVDITGKEPGYTEVTFLDQYYQEQTVRVTVEDAILELDREELTVSGSNYEYIVANKAHTGIKSVETDNDHASAQVVTLPDGERVVKVSANSAGVTIVTVYDYEGLEGNKDTVVVTVGSGSGGDTGGEIPPIEEEEITDGNFQTINYEEKQSEEGISTIVFKLDGNPKEVGVFYLKGEDVYIQELEKEKNGWYILACGDVCPEKSVPYIVDPNGNYKKANVEYYNFGQENYEITNVVEDGVDVNYRIFAGNDLYQVGTSAKYSDVDKFNYLYGIEQAIEDFLDYDIGGQILYSWDEATVIELSKLSSGERTLQSSIDAVPEIKQAWEQINTEIDALTHFYAPGDRKTLKGYLGASAVIEEKKWEAFDQGRVVEMIMKFHELQKIPEKEFWTGSYDFKMYLLMVQVVDHNIQKSLIFDSEARRKYSDGTYPHFYTPESLEYLYNKGYISLEEQRRLVLYEEYQKYVATLAISEIEAFVWGEGNSAGRNAAFADYLVETVSLFNPLELYEFYEGMKNFDPSDIPEELKVLWDAYKNMDDIIETISEYEITEYDKGYYMGYIEVTLLLTIIPFKYDKVNAVKTKKVENRCPLSDTLSVASNCDRDIVEEVKELIKLYDIKRILEDTEVMKTLERIALGEGKYSKDGTTFENRAPVGELEPKLPIKEEGYYTEWTVDTPGLDHRGARRIVKGSNGEMYYTEDHYTNFIQIN